MMLMVMMFAVKRLRKALVYHRQHYHRYRCLRRSHHHHHRRHHHHRHHHFHHHFFDLFSSKHPSHRPRSAVKECAILSAAPPPLASRLLAPARRFSACGRTNTRQPLKTGVLSQGEGLLALRIRMHSDFSSGKSPRRLAGKECDKAAPRPWFGSRVHLLYIFPLFRGDWYREAGRTVKVHVEKEVKKKRLTMMMMRMGMLM